MPIISPARVAHWVVDVVDLSWLRVTKDLGPYLSMTVALRGDSGPYPALRDQWSSFLPDTMTKKK